MASAVKKEFLFDADSAFKGEFTVECGGKSYTFKTYQAKYCDAPYTDEWPNAAEHFKLNVKVPVRAGDEEIDPTSLAGAPILFYMPWGGDRGYAVGDPGAISTRGGPVDALVAEAFANGWVVVEPGMRGAANCFHGNPGDPDFRNYGKLPGPLADLKAAVRYLRYETNAENIPGDKEHIWIAGTSSGGSGTGILGSSGNSPFFEEALKEIGALPGRDDVFGAFPSCPVMVRQWGDNALCWERWGDLSGNPDADPVNAWFANAFIPYFNALGLKAVHGTGSIKAGDALTADNYAEYLMQFVRQSCVRFLNTLGGRAAVEAYLAENKPGLSIYFTPDYPRTWITPVFDGENPDLVVDIKGEWSAFWNYVVGDEMFDPARLCDLQYERAVNALDSMFDGNGILNPTVGDRFSPYLNASSVSFGKPGEYAAVFSPSGLEYLQKVRNMEISREYLDLLDMQCCSVDPLYFVIGGGAAEAVTCKYWYMRTGSIDLVSTLPLFYGLATALENTGCTVDAALVWEQGHGLTADFKPFFPFAEKAMAGK